MGTGLGQPDQPIASGLLPLDVPRSNPKLEQHLLFMQQQHALGLCWRRGRGGERLCDEQDLLQGSARGF